MQGIDERLSALFTLESITLTPLNSGLLLKKLTIKTLIQIVKTNEFFLTLSPGFFVTGVPDGSTSTYFIVQINEQKVGGILFCLFTNSRLC